MSYSLPGLVFLALHKISLLIYMRRKTNVEKKNNRDRGSARENNSYRGEESILDSLEYVLMLHNLEVLCFAQEHFIRVLSGLKHGRAGAWVHLRHLLGHLACSWHFSFH